MSNKIVPVQTFASEVEADVARIHLEESGIPAFVFSDDPQRVALAAATGYAVHVREQDLDRARQVIEEE